MPVGRLLFSSVTKRCEKRATYRCDSHLYTDHGASGARAQRPGLEAALTALEPGDTLVVATLDRLSRSTQNMFALAEIIRARGAGLRVLNLGGGEVDTASPMGAMIFTVMVSRRWSWTLSVSGSMTQ